MRKKKPPKTKADALKTVEDALNRLIDTYTAVIDRLEETGIKSDARIESLEKRVAALEELFGIDGDEPQDDPAPVIKRTWFAWFCGE